MFRQKCCSLIFLVPFVIVAGESDVKSSLTFVIDDTGSMGDDIALVIENVNLVFNTVTHSKKSQIENFILVTFNDPDAKTLAVTKDADVFKRALNSIDVNGGGDCPEYAMTGIEEALEKSLPGSYFYVFTDASAKDYKKLERVQSLALGKQTQIVFLLTGECRDSSYIGKQRYQAYHALAHATSGNVFHMHKSEVGKILKYISDTVENRKTKITSATFPPGKHTLPFTVDVGIKNVTVVATGESPTAKVHTSDGKETVTKTVVNVTGGIVINVPNPAPGTYGVTVESPSGPTVSVSGETTIRFQHGFSILRPTTATATTTTKPIAGEKSYLSVWLTSEDDIGLDSIEIVDMDDKLIMAFPAAVIDEKEKFYATQAFVTPNHIFKIVINAYDRKSKTKIRRYGLTPIEPQKPHLVPVIAIPPSIEILEGLDIQVDYGKHLRLTCKVSAHPKPDIMWMDVNSKTVMKSKDAMIEYPSEYVSEMEIRKVHENATYRCIATNSHGIKESGLVQITTIRKKYLNIIERPEDIAIEYDKEGSVKCKADASPPATITWYMNGAGLKDNDNIQITKDSLLIHNMQPNLAGKYTCEAKNDFDISLVHFEIAITGLEAPAIDKNVHLMTALKGSDAYIICSVVSGTPPPTISWTFKHKDSPGYDIIAASTNRTDLLYLEKLTLEHSGTYKCTARNIVGKDYHFIDFNVEYKPTIKSDLTVIKAKEGTTPVLKCVVDAVPAAHVRWFLNDNLIIPSRDHHVYRDHSLRIKASIENSGMYRCEAENVHGKATRNVRVDYFASVNIQIPKDTTIVTRVGGNLTLPCNADGYPKPEIQWKFFNPDPEKRSKVLRTPYPQELVLKNIQLSQDGFYTCTAKNIGEMVNITYRVIVNAPAVIVNANDNDIYRAVLGDLVLRVPCKATGNPKPEISWKFRNLDIATKTDWHDVEDDGTLVIKNIDMKSRGYFTCKAENKFGSDEKHFLVDVSRIPKDVNPKTIMKLHENETVAVECGVPHKEVDLVRWFKDNKQIAEDELHLEKVTSLDAGVYTCRVSNFTGSVSASTELIVGFAPSFEFEVDLDLDFEEGSYAELDCLSRSEPEAYTQWFLDGKKIAAADQMHAFVMDYSNMGTYTCMVYNEYGSINRTFNIKPQGCLLNIPYDFQGNQPLIIPSRHLPLKTIGGYLHISRYEVVKLVCPERFTRFSEPEIYITCEQNNTFKVEDMLYTFAELHCTSLMIPEVNGTGFRCAKGNTELVNVGYSIDAGTKFLPVYEVCVDKYLRIPVYTKHILDRSSAGVDPIDGKWQDNYLVPFDYQQMYNCDAQTTHISNSLGRSFHDLDRCCFNKRQLVSPRDVMPGLTQAATYNNLNVIPHWSTCNTRNWDEMEQRVRNLAKYAASELLVWTGHSVQKPLVLKTASAENWLVNIRQQLVSKYLWKVVQDTASRSSLAIIQVNVPDLKASDKEKHTLCTDICHKIEWMKDREWDEVSEGYIYCCEIRDFEKAFGYKNAFSPSGDRILQYVSILAVPSLTA